MAHQNAREVETRKEADAQLITVGKHHDVPWQEAIKMAVEKSEHTEKRGGFTYEQVREFADSIMFAVWHVDHDTVTN